jgi:hypothetical protein
MLVSLEISNKDKAYDWFLAWMAHQTQVQAQTSGIFPVHPLPLGPLGTKPPAERGDDLRATEERELVRAVQPRRWTGNTLV